MLKLTQPGKGKRRLRLRLRLSALLCLLLLLGASTAEVVHHHPGDFPTQKASKQSQPDKLSQDKQSPDKQKAPEVCPLCMAMHAVLPSAALPTIAPVRAIQETPHAAAAPRYSSLWSFDLFGRPPPAPVTAHI